MIDKSEIELINFLQGLLYASECKSNYYSSSDLNVSFEFNEEFNRPEIKDDFKSHLNKNWIDILTQKLEEWIFRFMPNNNSDHHQYAKRDLIKKIIETIKQIVTSTGVCLVIENENYPANDGFLIEWRKSDRIFSLSIELYD